MASKKSSVKAAPNTLPDGWEIRVRLDVEPPTIAAHHPRHPGGLTLSDARVPAAVKLAGIRQMGLETSHVDIVRLGQVQELHDLAFFVALAAGRVQKLAPREREAWQGLYDAANAVVAAAGDSMCQALHNVKQDAQAA